MKNIKVVAAIIIKNGKIFVARRKKHLHHGGFWEFPGGKIKNGETIQEALERELMEEFGMVIEAGEILGDVTVTIDDLGINLIGVTAQIIRGIEFLNDHDQVNWVDEKKLAELELGKADVVLWNKVKQFLRGLNGY
ncbi:MAG: (deoxy)nucleoside triphosphate pyrophosphohydrolase [Calditrichia bacterium]